jgi:hypothetical protein
MVELLSPYTVAAGVLFAVATLCLIMWYFSDDAQR